MEHDKGEKRNDCLFFRGGKMLLYHGFFLFYNSHSLDRTFTEKNHRDVIMSCLSFFAPGGPLVLWQDSQKRRKKS